MAGREGGIAESAPRFPATKPFLSVIKIMPNCPSVNFFAVLYYFSSSLDLSAYTRAQSNSTR
jgi:hypothetical protein